VAFVAVASSAQRLASNQSTDGACTSSLIVSRLGDDSIHSLPGEPGKINTVNLLEDVLQLVPDVFDEPFRSFQIDVYRDLQVRSAPLHRRSGTTRAPHATGHVDADRYSRVLGQLCTLTSKCERLPPHLRHQRSHDLRDVEIPRELRQRIEALGGRVPGDSEKKEEENPRGASSHADIPLLIREDEDNCANRWKSWDEPEIFLS
jgi:hypothetical protein